jgi:hypothetical protein
VRGSDKQTPVSNPFLESSAGQVASTAAPRPTSPSPAGRRDGLRVLRRKGPLRLGVPPLRLPGVSASHPSTSSSHHLHRRCA